MFSTYYEFLSYYLRCLVLLILKEFKDNFTLKYSVSFENVSKAVLDAIFSICLYNMTLCINIFFRKSQVFTKLKLFDTTKCN